MSTTTERFDRLAAEARPRLYRQAMMLTRNAELSQDLTQITLIKAARAFDSFDSERSTFLNWTMRILQRSLFDDVRRRSRRLSPVSLDGIMDNSDTNLDAFDIIDEQIDLLGEVISHERTAFVASLVSRLPQEYAEALQMSFLDGYSYEEVASHQGVSVGTVRSRIYRAKQLLIQIIQSEQIALL